MKIRTKLLANFLFFTALVLILGISSLSELRSINTLVRNSSAQWASETTLTAQNTEYAMDMRYLDEVLTQSARNYAFTGDRKWRDRYTNAEPTLDAKVKRAINISHEVDREAFERIDKANLALVEMEHKSLTYVDEGRRQEAIAILESKDYWDQKEVYQDGLEEIVNLTAEEHRQSIELFSELSNRISQDVEKEYDKSARNNSLTLTFSLLATLLIAYHMITSVVNPLNRLTEASRKITQGEFDMSIVKSPDDEMGELSKVFQTMSQTIKTMLEAEKAHSLKLEESINERTKELQAKVLELERTRAAVLNMLADLRESKEGVDRKIEERTRELEKALKEIKEADEVKDDFLAITSHELKTPLTSIIGLTQLLEEELAEKTNPDEKEDLKIVLEEANRLKRLIDEILELARLDAGKKMFKMTELDMGKIIAEIVYELRTLSGQNNVAVEVGETSAPHVFGDFDAVKRVVYNIVNNAIKYSSDVGERHVAIGAYRENEEVITYVRDNGIGIPEEVKDKIFQRFYQVDSSISRKHGGTGLGLAICKKIIDAHKGRIWFGSKVGAGATFYFSLPIFTNKGGDAG